MFRKVLKLKLISAGIKNGPLPDADYYVDCRSMPNPFHAPELKGQGGTAKVVQNWIVQHTSIGKYYGLVEEAISRIPVRRNNKDNPFEEPFVICFFCAHGIHRSVATKKLVEKYLLEKGYMVEAS